MVTSSDEQIRAAFTAEKIGSEITCPKAQAICKKYGIEPASLGEYCNKEGIKLRHCMFGCFT
ncbi:hypothetical protein O0S10_10110 [Methanocorpusculum sp. MG]|uniref:Uncharacterized protein n=1 Tax=Methanocorpusculum petauri TaxID=3002863 RepID=A0ABT4IJY0_9EURY|nr:hypothetical protein [Methanocorpusculum petauri]MCZ0861567.1 hypothetical protein [Methanocorpusculum petauri]MCZ9311959.1 hypothetical protein [Methanocorpusculum sp.]